MRCTVEQKRLFHALLRQSGQMKYKEDMLSRFGVVSTSELSFAQADELITELRILVHGKSTPVSDDVRVWRHKVLVLVQKCGVDTTDWVAVNRFVCQPRIAGKLLYLCSVGELKVLHRKLFNVSRSVAKKSVFSHDKEVEFVPFIISNNMAQA